MSIYFLLISIVGLLFGNPTNEKVDLKTGDLIFQESCRGNMGEAIKGVTASINDYNFTHVGIVWIDQKQDIFVIEATQPYVTITPLYNYLYPEESENCFPKSVAARLRPEYWHLIPDAIEEGLKLVGKEYDNGFVLNNDKYYCSELIYDIFMKANKNKPVFELNVMTFKPENSDNYHQNWIEHFEKYNLPIPEGELGINPGAMSESAIIEILYEMEKVPKTFAE